VASVEGDGGASIEAGVTTPGPGPDPLPTPGCGAEGVKKGFLGSQTIDVAGTKRTYEMFVPDGYDGRKTYPLVFVFHGDGGTGANIRGSIKLEAESSGEAIFVYPDGLNKTWTIDKAPGLLRDTAFVEAVSADLGKGYCVDKARTFAVGFSRGAYFTNMLACVGKANLRAIVTHAGGGPFGLEGSGTTFEGGKLVCPAPPVAALQVQGEADQSVKLPEGQKARDHWQRVNGCQTTTKPMDPSPCVAYDGCAAERPEVWCQVPALQHRIWDQGAKVTWSFLKSK